MSDNQNAVLPENLERAAWVKRVLKVETRQRAMGEAINREVSRAQPTDQPDGDSKTRASLVRRLTALNQKAIDFAGIAPRRAYGEIREEIRAIEGMLGRAEWTEAHKAITAVETQIDETAPACRKLRDLQQEIQRVTLKLDKAYPFLLPKDLAIYDQLLLDLEQSTGLDAVDKAAETLRKAEGDIDHLADEGEKRLGRIETLQKKRLLAEAETTRLRERADEFGLAELLGRAKTLLTDLADLASSTDEKALEQALVAAETLQKDSEAPFALGDKKRREGLLEDLRKRMEQLLADKKALLDSAVPSLLEPVDEAHEALIERLKASPDTDTVVDQAELSFQELSGYIDDVETQMLDVEAWQQRMQPRLAKYKPLEDEDELDELYNDLPEILKDPSADGWATAEEWLDLTTWAPWRFMSAWAARLKNNAAALASEAYQDAVARKKSICEPFLALKRKALPQHQTDGDNLVNQINLLIQGGQPTKSLDPIQAATLDQLFKDLTTLVTLAKKNIDDKRDEAQKIDGDDGGHSVKRHGPDISDAKLESRLKTGYSPDGVFSPATKSSRFNSYDDLIDTRTAAFAAIAATVNMTVATLFGADLDQAPDPANTAAVRTYTTHQITHNHTPRVIGTGLRGTTVSATFIGGGQTYSAFTAMPGLTRTYTKLVWNPGKSRWVAVQHFPTDV